MIDISKLSRPPEFWEYFQKISDIPRCSGNEEKIRAYVKEEAEKFHFPTRVDDVGNLLVNLTLDQRRDKKTVILQSHFDMVCEKNSSSVHEFGKDSLKLKIIEKNGTKWITADGTSLGADNGGGMAYSLALMKRIHQKKLKFPNINLKLLFTVNEEGGLVGAFQIEKDMLGTDYLINLDCMDVDTIIIGCAGGMYTNLKIRINRQDISAQKTKFIPFELSVKGLLGGHSGLDIDRGRANAIKVLARVLLKLNKEFQLYLENIEGGDNFNAIPRESKALIYLNKEDSSHLESELNEIKKNLNEYYRGSEDNILLMSEKIPDREADFNIILDEIKNKLLNMLYSMPHGPLLWHPVIENIVHTSTNLASISTTRTKIKIGMLHRSFNEDFNDVTAERVEALLELGGFNYKIRNVGGYGVWKPDFEEELLKKAQQVYKEVNNEDVTITAMHAGLEPGAFKNKYPNLQMITIGPNIEACHSPDECLQIKSVEKFWNFLTTLLQEL